MARVVSHHFLTGLSALALLLFMAVRIDWMGRQSPGTPARLRSGEIEPALVSLLERHRAASARLAHNDYFYPGLGLGFGWGLQFGTVQARILALYHPQETEAFVLRIAEGLGAPKSDLEFATRVLGILASQGHQASLEALLRLARGQDESVVPLALQGVFACDEAGLSRSLYPAACKRGILEAFDEGPYWVDRETKEALREILAKSLKTYDSDSFTTEALERMRILESPQRESLLEQLVEGVPPKGGWSAAWSDWRQRWALRVLQKARTPRILETLRRRLEREEASFAHRSYAVSPTHPGWPDTSDYDEYLLAYMKLGGNLNAVETERLTYYGYLGDPSRRLRELLAHW